MDSYQRLYLTFINHLEGLTQNQGPASVEYILANDEQESIPWALLQAIKDWGYCEYLIPSYYGGKFHNLLQIYLLTKAIAQYDITAAILRGLAYFASIPIWIGGQNQQAQWVSQQIRKGKIGSIALTEFHHGSDINSNETSAVLLDDHFIVSGEKWAINHAKDSVYSIILAKTGKNFSPLSYSLLMLDKTQQQSGLEILPKLKTHGARGMHVSGLRFDDLLIPKKNIIGKSGEGMGLTFKTLQVSRTLCAGLSCGGAIQALKMAYNFSQKRQLYHQSINKIPAVRQRLAIAYAKYLVADLFSIGVMRAASFYPENLNLWSAMIKFFVPQTVDEVIEECGKVLGARGYLREHDYSMYQKLRRDSQLISIFDGSSEVNLSLIGQHLLQQAKNRHNPNKLSLNPAIFNLDHEVPFFEHKALKYVCKDIDVLTLSTEIDRHPAIVKDCEFLSKTLSTIDKEILTKHETKDLNPQELSVMQLSEDYCRIVSALCSLRFGLVNQRLRPAQAVINLFIAILKLRYDNQPVAFDLYDSVYEIAVKKISETSDIV